MIKNEFSEAQEALTVLMYCDVVKLSCSTRGHCLFNEVTHQTTVNENK